MFSPRTDKVYKVMDVLISLMEVLISQCICIPSHHVVHLKYIQFLFVNYTSVNLRRTNKKIKLRCSLQSRAQVPHLALLMPGMIPPAARLDLPCTWISSLSPILLLPVPGTDSHKIAVSKPQPPALGTQDKTNLLDTKVIKTLALIPAAVPPRM